MAEPSIGTDQLPPAYGWTTIDDHNTGVKMVQAIYEHSRDLKVYKDGDLIVELTQIQALDLDMNPFKPDPAQVAAEYHCGDYVITVYKVHGLAQIAIKNFTFWQTR